MLKKILLATAFVCSFDVHCFAAEAPKFRDLFVSILADMAPHVDPNAVIYAPPEDFATDPSQGDVAPLANLTAIDKTFAKFQPHDMYARGQQVEAASIASAEIDAQLSSKPVTLVLIPGYLSEFATTPFAGEAFSASSSLAKKWGTALAQHGGDALATDTYYSLGDGLTYKDSLARLISVASLDQNGQPLVRLVGFRFPEMQTLESVGTVEEVSAIYTRRLEKTLQLLGTELPNIVLIGHSRGTAVALDMLAKAHAAHKDWVKNIKGVVSYSGVVSGVSSADRIDQQGTDEWKGVQANRELQNNLKTGSNLNPFVLFGNLNSFLKYKFANDAINRNTTARLNAAYGSSDIHNAAFSGTDLILNKLGDQLNVSGGGTKAAKMKIFIDKTLVALEGLRTSERLAWWKANTLPSIGVKYYSIGATMTDPRRSADDLLQVQTSPTLLMTSNDYKIGLKSYRTILLEPGVTTFDYNTSSALNDGNVHPQRAIFWPKLIASLNPANQLNTEFLGLFGVNHFALAHANVSGDGAVNPFPRTAVLKAIASKVSFDLQ